MLAEGGRRKGIRLLMLARRWHGFWRRRVEGIFVRPGEFWMRCAEAHLRKGDRGDALWALDRARRYSERIGAKEHLKKVEEASGKL